MRVWEGGRTNGPVLLAIHGLGGSGRYWRGLEDLAGERFRIVAPDLAGFGRSAKPAGATYDRAFHLADLDALADREEGEVVVVGHSLGGVLSALWAGRNTDRLAALSLHAAPYPEPHPEWDPSVWAGPRSLAPAVVGGMARLTWPLISLPAQLFSRYPDAIIRDYGRQTMRSRGRTLWSLWSEPGLEAVVLDAAAAIEAPVLLQHAEDDRSVALANLERWAAALPRATSQRLPDGGHQFLLHQRFEPLRAWLDGLGVADPR